MKRQFCSLLMALLFAGGIAADGQPELYDGLYGRPSYYSYFHLPTQWPNNMSYFVRPQLESTGEMITNYEVAVFDQDNQLRAVSRSIAQDDEMCTLTICGSEGESFWFLVVYGDFDRPTFAVAREHCDFVTNDVVGNVVQPFLLTVTESTGIETVQPDATSPTACDLFGRPVDGDDDRPGLRISAQGITLIK